ncbi:MAG: hypothetical protein DMG77_09110 [Acidobacteria bacterium]|nr:MAG: hypothetical protein DMG77_09110 [Acidobacteriota bacterium]
MKRVGTCWSTIAALLALATMLGCQGVSSVWSGAQSGAKLMATPARVEFGNVQIGTSQTPLGRVTVDSNNSESGYSNIAQAVIPGP